jgi:hypothetical protein
LPASPEAAKCIAHVLEDHLFVPSGFEGLMDAYYKALASRSALQITTEDARRSLELVAALYHSAATSAAVALPIALEHPKYVGW